VLADAVRFREPLVTRLGLKSIEGARSCRRHKSLRS